ncbi:MAG: hypothetical protein ACO3VQ_12710, partial [Ilumatobacteraceae bacterium]
MNSFQESKNELEAAIRYAENAISSAQGTIESMEFRQEMAKKQYAEQTGREEALTKKVQELEDKVQGQYDDIKRLEYDLTAKTAQAGAWKKDVEFYTKKYNELAQQKDDLEAQVNALEQPERATMPVIPKAVAIAIFREGMAYGAGNVCDELENADSIMVEDSDNVGNFEVSFSMYVDLTDHLDTDWLRSQAVDNSDEEWVVDCLKTLCADNKFECRIHGID